MNTEAGRALRHPLHALAGDYCSKTLNNPGGRDQAGGNRTGGFDASDEAAEPDLRVARPQVLQ